MNQNNSAPGIGAAASGLGIVAYIAGGMLSAGLFAIPLQVPVVGLVPMLLIVGTVATISTLMYPRVVAASALVSTGEQSVSIGDVLYAVGGGRAGRMAGMAGALLAGIPSVVGYMLIAIEALRSIANTLEAVPDPAVAAAVGSFSLFLVSGSSRSAIAPLAAMGCRWFAGIAVVHVIRGVADQMSVAVETTVLGISAFAAVSTLFNNQALGVADGMAAPFGLRRDHGRNAVTVIVQTLVLLTIGAYAVGLMVGNGSLESPSLIRSEAGISDYVNGIGVAYFAYTASAMFNVCGYPAMRRPRSRSRLMRTAIATAFVIQAMWIIAISVTTSGSRLTEADRIGDNSASALAGSVGAVAPMAQFWAGPLAATIILFAVTAGANANTELVVNEWFLAGRAALGRRPNPATTDPVRRIPLRARLVLVFTAVAIAFDLASVPTIHVLGAGGMLGGLFLATIVPMLVEPRAERRSLAVVGACLIAVVGGLAVTAGLAMDQNRPWFVAPAAAVACISTGVVVAAAANIARSGPVGPRSNGLNPVEPHRPRRLGNEKYRTGCPPVAGRRAFQVR